MSSLLLIPWPETGWSAAGRIEGRSPVPLTEAGRAVAAAWARSLADTKIDVVFSGPEQAAVATARLLAGPRGARTKAMESFFEVDVGLWDGLAEEDLRRRSPKAYKTWRDDPASICPPEGETLVMARARLCDGLAKLARKHALDTIPIVLGPLAFAVTRCIVESKDLTEVRTLASTEPIQYMLSKDNGELAKLADPGAHKLPALAGNHTAKPEKENEHDG